MKITTSGAAVRALVPLLAVGLVAPCVVAQATSATVRVSVSSAIAGTPLPGVVVASGSVAVQTDERGRAVLVLAPGRSLVSVRRLGYAADTAGLMLRAGLDTTLFFALRQQAAVIAPVFVSSARTERRVEDEPLRIEVLAGEDVGEKTQMRPADLRLLLTEMSGVRVQPTSPSLGAASVRVQGLPGRYTQILTDGLPLYGASAGSFGLLQVPPLDLRQAEVIKGAATALYGPGAMGGVLNLISRRTPDSSEALANVTARGGADLVVFGARDLSPRSGVTVLGGVHRQRASDVNGDGWSDIPGFRRVELRPRFFESDSGGRALMLTAGGFAEDRGGGSIGAWPARGEAFPESLSTRHADVGDTVRMAASSRVTLAAKFAGNVQERTRRFGAQREDEHSSTLFAEATATLVSGAHTLLGGASAQGERYRNAAAPRFDESRSTPALFVQHTYSPNAWLSTQLNGRCDASSVYGTICTPRLSVLAHSGAVLSVRLSGGAGWAAPNALDDETEVFGLTRVAGPLRLSAERARTASLDVGSLHGPVELSGTLFASRVDDAVGVRRIAGDTSGHVELVNAAGPARVHGGELFAVYNQEPVIVTAFYAATRSRETSPESGRVRESPYLPRESAGLDAAFEEDESGTRVGVEVFYTGPQALEENPYRTVAPSYTTIGLLASQRVGSAILYVNLENLTNVRQTRSDPLLRPLPGEGGRLTVGEWAPLDGRMLNAGVRIRL